LIVDTRVKLVDVERQCPLARQILHNDKVTVDNPSQKLFTL
jgi:hypothetical protein